MAISTNDYFKEDITMNEMQTYNSTEVVSAKSVNAE